MGSVCPQTPALPKPPLSPQSCLAFCWCSISIHHLTSASVSWPGAQMFKSRLTSFSYFKFYLLLSELLLYFIWVTGIIDYRLGQLRLDVSQPRPQAAHVLIQLLYGDQGLLQLLNPVGRGETSLKFPLWAKVSTGSKAKLPRAEVQPSSAT